MVRTYKRLPQGNDKRREKCMIFFGLSLLVLLSASVIFATKTCYRWLHQSGFFRVNSVHITGCQRVSKEEIRELANVDIHSNILAIDVDKVGQTLEMHPWVKHATVRRELPDRLFIHIIEKQPIAILQDGGLYHVDEDATIIARTGLAEDIDYPIITGLRKEDVLSASVQVLHLQKLLPLLYVKKKVEDVLPARNISEIHVDKEKGLILYTVDGRFPIRLGTGDIEKKFKCLETVLYDIYQKEAYSSVAYVDCDYYSGKIMVRKTIKSS